jgi:uncharacterized membrane protein required for colicin V production
MNPADILDLVAFGLVALGCVLGLIRGLSGELARVLAFFGAFVGCGLFAPPWKRACAGWCGDERFLGALLAVVGVLFIAALSGWLVRKFVDKCLRVLVPQPANSLLGGIFGAAGAFLLAAVLCFLLSLLPVDFIQTDLLGPSRYWHLAGPLASAASSWF